MKLLFDQNLSPSLVDSLADIYPESVHVQSAGLDRADDRAVWDFARLQNLVIVTKDADFLFEAGVTPPPSGKVIGAAELKNMDIPCKAPVARTC